MPLSLDEAYKKIMNEEKASGLNNTSKKKSLDEAYKEIMAEQNSNINAPTFRAPSAFAERIQPTPKYNLPSSYDDNTFTGDDVKTYMSDLKNSFVAGTQGGMGSLSDALSYVTNKVGLDNVSNTAQNWARSWEEDARNRMGQVVDPNGFGNRVASGLGSSLSMLIPGAVTAGASAIAGAPVMTGIGGAAIAGILGGSEAAGTAGEVYRNLIDQGYSEEEANRASNRLFFSQAPLDILTEYGLGGVLGNARGLSRLIKNPWIRSTLGEGAQEALQETYQGMLQPAAERSANQNLSGYIGEIAKEGKNIPQYAKQEGLPAAVAGMLMGGAGGAARKILGNVTTQKPAVGTDGAVPGAVAPTPNATNPTQTIKKNIDIITPIMTAPATQAETFRGLASGLQDQIYTSNGRTAVPITYKAVPADALNVSNTTDFAINKNYPQEFQPRDRTRAVNQTQVDAIANNLNPDLLGQSARASDGAPVTDVNGTVIAGNGRSLAIQRAYKGQTDRSSQYKNWLVKNAGKFGLDPTAVNNMQNPVLVRVLGGNLTPETLANFAADSNVSVTAGMSATEQARTDAQLLSPHVLGQYHNDVDLMSAENKPFMRTFVEQLPQSERNEFLDSKGNITQTGVRRIKNALFASAYGDAALSERMSESTDDNTRLINEGMLRSAPSIAAVESGVRNGTVRKEYSLASDIAAAVNKMSDLRNSGVKVSDYLNQRMAFEDAELSSNAKKILAFLDRNARNVNKVRDLFNEYAHNALRFGDPHQQNLFGEQAPTNDELLDAAIKRVTGEDDLFFVGQKAARKEDRINKNSDRINALRTAEDMENRMNAKLFHPADYPSVDTHFQQAMNNETIWAATGWYRGLDGHWRYEIPSGKLKTDLSNIYPGMNYKLKDIIDAPQLFKIYPTLKNIDFVFGKEKPEVWGYFDPNKKLIRINKDLQSHPQQVLTSIIHEMQHVIQHKEGFAPGANTIYSAGAQKLFNTNYAENNKLDLEKYFNKRGVKLPDSFLSFIIDYEKATRAAISPQSSPSVKAQEAKKILEMEKPLPDDAIARLRAAVSNLINIEDGNPTSIEMYMNSAGEIEARNAEARANFTDEDRKSQFPLMKEQPGDKNVIVSRIKIEEPLRYPEDTFADNPPAAPKPAATSGRSEAVRQINLFDDGQAPIPFRLENANQVREQKYNAAIKEGNIKEAQKLVNEAAEEAGFDASGQVDDSGIFIGDKNHSYRGTAPIASLGHAITNTPVSDWGHMMFTDNPDEAYWSKDTSKIQDELYSVSFDDLVDIDDLRDEIIQKINEDRENPETSEWGKHDFSYLDNTSAEEIADEFNPKWIVESAGAWDNGDLLEWFWNRIGEPHDLKGVKTQDGAIAFEGSGIVKRVANNTAILKDDNGNIIPLAKRFDTTEKEMEFDIANPKESRALRSQTTNSKESLLTRAQDVMDQLNQIVPIRRGVKGPAGMLGVYKRDADVARIRYRNDIPTALHEVGHKLDVVLNLRDNVKAEGSTKINSELEQLGVASSPKSKLGDLEYLRKEGIAEFFRLWSLDPTQAHEKAPTYYDKFEDALESNPEIQTLANQAGEIARAYYHQNPEQRLDASIVEGSWRSKKYSWKRVKEAFYYMFLDDKIFLKKFTDQVKTFLLEHNPEILVKDKKGRYWMPDELNLYAQVRDSPGYMGKVSIYLDKIQPIVKGIGTQQYKQLNRLMAAQGAMDYWTNGMEPGIGITKAEAQHIIDATPQNIKDAAAKIRQAYGEIVDDTMVKAGIWTQEQLATWREKYPYYVPFQRLSETGDLTYHASGAGGLKIVNMTDPHKKRTGVGSIDAQQSIRSPLESMYSNIRTYAKMAAKNEAAQTLVKLSQIDGFGWAAEQLQDHTKEGKKDTVYVWQNGKKVWYQVDPDIYNSLVGLEERIPPYINGLINFFSIPAKTLKLGATGLNIAFGPVNAFRDAMQSSLTSDSWRAPFVGTAKGLLMQISKNSEKKQRVKAAFEAGLKYSGIYELGLGSTEESVSKHIKHLIHGDSAWSRFVMAYNNTVGSFNEAVEMAPKLAEFEYLRSQGVPLKQAVMMAREVNNDFGRAGSLGRIINRPVAFFNAGMQGLDKMLRSGLEQRSKFLLKTAMFIAVPTVLNWAMHKDDDEYRRLSRHLRDNFWLIKTGEHSWLRFPKPEGLQPLMGAVERALDYAFHKDPEAFNGMLDSFGDILPNFAPTAGIPIWQHFTNTSFTGVPLVPRKLQNLPPEMQYTRNTSKLAKILGRAFKASPIIIDNYISGYTGGVGKTAVRIPDVIADMTGASEASETEAKTLGEYPILNRWTANSLNGSEPVQRFYDLLDQSTKAYNGFKADLKAGNHPELTADVKIAKTMTKASSMMSKISSAIAATRERNDMTGEEKRARNEELREKQIQLAERILQKYEEMKESK